MNVVVSCRVKHRFPGGPYVHFHASFCAPVCGPVGTHEAVWFTQFRMVAEEHFALIALFFTIKTVYMLSIDT